MCGIFLSPGEAKAESGELSLALAAWDEALLLKGLEAAVDARTIATLNEYEAQLLMEAEDYFGAIHTCDRALEVWPHLLAAEHTRARAQLELGELTMAETGLRALQQSVRQLRIASDRFCNIMHSLEFYGVFVLWFLVLPGRRIRAGRRGSGGGGARGGPAALPVPAGAGAPARGRDGRSGAARRARATRSDLAEIVLRLAHGERVFASTLPARIHTAYVRGVLQGG